MVRSGYIPAGNLPVSKTIEGEYVLVTKINPRDFEPIFSEINEMSYNMRIKITPTVPVPSPTRVIAIRVNFITSSGVEVSLLIYSELYDDVLILNRFVVEYNKYDEQTLLDEFECYPNDLHERLLVTVLINLAYMFRDIGLDVITNVE